MSDEMDDKNPDQPPVSGPVRVPPTAGATRDRTAGKAGNRVAGAPAQVRPTVAKGARGASAKAKGPAGAPVPALPPLPRMRKKSTPKECECGCGMMTRGGRFIPGHDSRLKGWALRVERQVIALKDIPDEGVRRAVARLLKPKKQVG